MKKTILIIAIILLSCLNIFAQAVLTNEEYAVYAGVIEKHYENLKPDKSIANLAIIKNTVEPNFAGIEVLLQQKSLTNNWFSESLPDRIIRSDFDEAVEDLKEKSSNTTKLEHLFSIQYKYSLITKSDVDILLEEGKKDLGEYFKSCNPCHKGYYSIWEPFLKKYQNSNGYYSFSRVGFSKNEKLAVVYETSYRGDKYSWMINILKKKSDGWKVTGRSGGGWVK